MSQAPPYNPTGRPLMPPPPPSTNGLGLAGFIVSLVGMVLCMGVICPVGAILSAIALVWKPRGFAIAGLILGVLGSVLWGVLLVVWFSRFPSYFSTNDLWMAQDEIDVYHYDHSNTLPDDATGQQLVSYYNDDWGTAYSYRYVDPQTYEIISAGPDMQFGTSDDQVTSASPQVPYYGGSQNSPFGNDTTSDVIDNAHEIIERTYAGDYESPAWHEVQNTLTGSDTDEWGNAIRYNAGEGKDYELRSSGPDGQMDTDDDIVQTYTLGASAEEGEAEEGAEVVPEGEEQP